MQLSNTKTTRPARTVYIGSNGVERTAVTLEFAVTLAVAGIPVNRADLYVRAGVEIAEALDVQARHEAGEDTDSWLTTLAALR